jgi:hypothetical protein
MAIKVNGTTVIDDSRALSNIASVDATTVAAMGAAGVGGQTTLVSSDVSVSQAATLLLPIGDYKINRYVLEGLQSQSSGGDNAYQRMTDSSGSTITTSDYISIMGQLNTVNRATSVSSLVPGSNNIDVPSTSLSGTGSGWNAEITVLNGYSSSKRTVVHVSCSESVNQSACFFQWTMNTARRNQHVVLFMGSGSNFTATGSYTHWGIS